MTARIEGVRITVSDDGVLDIDPVNPEDRIVLVPPVHIRNELAKEKPEKKDPAGAEAVTHLRLAPGQGHGKSLETPEPVKESSR